jgi:hypothetical protein
LARLFPQTAPFFGVHWKIALLVTVKGDPAAGGNVKANFVIPDIKNLPLEGFLFDFQQGD